MKLKQEKLKQLTPCCELMLNLENERKGRENVLVGGASDLYHFMRGWDVSLVIKEKERCPARGIGKFLSKIFKEFPARCWQDIAMGKRRLWIFISDRVENPKMEEEAIVELILRTP